IYVIRGKKIMLDRDLSLLYNVTTGNLNKAIRRNKERFPSDFMFQLTRKEYRSLRFQSGILKRGAHSKYLPHAFTQEGIAMLSSVLRSKRAAYVNIHIMRAFVTMRRILSTNISLKRKIDDLEKIVTIKFKAHDSQFQIVFATIKKLLVSSAEPKRKIGFR
ncbi:MAG: ORF6N domain-containing protein, partial [Candidatus Omnitrophica bacterium]|nr:ORF6N domain-containing protein [Candidatus Omnitrophota bacterium]